MHIGSLLLVVWLVIGGIAAGQRGDFKGSIGCSSASTIAVTIAGRPAELHRREPAYQLHHAAPQQLTGRRGPAIAAQSAVIPHAGIRLRAPERGRCPHSDDYLDPTSHLAIWAVVFDPKRADRAANPSPATTSARQHAGLTRR